MCDGVLQAFDAVRDPKTGQCPVALALRKEDAALLGQWGDTVGDIVYYLSMMGVFLFLNVYFIENRKWR